MALTPDGMQSTCQKNQLSLTADPKEQNLRSLEFNDYARLVAGWLIVNPQ